MKWLHLCKCYIYIVYCGFCLYGHDIAVVHIESSQQWYILYVRTCALCKPANYVHIIPTLTNICTAQVHTHFKYVYGLCTTLIDLVWHHALPFILPLPCITLIFTAVTNYTSWQVPYGNIL